jgi:hypothetical protein
MPKSETKFNPKVGHGFGNNAFGEGSILVKVEAEGFDNLMKNLQVGGSILLKYNKVTSKGNPHYFAEILPPYNAAVTKNTGKGRGTASELD